MIVSREIERRKALPKSIVLPFLNGRTFGDRNVLVALAAQGLKLLIQVSSIAVLSRRLSPEDFGVIAMVMAFAVLLDTIKDGGFASVLVQRENLTSQEANTALCSITFFSAVMGAITIASGPILAWYYDDPRTTLVAIPIAFAIFVGGWSSAYQALLRRKMRFTTLAIVEVAALGVGASAAILAAAMGFGFWSITVQSVVANLTLLMLSAWYCPSRPRFTFSFAVYRQFHAFGMNLTGFQLVNFLARNFDNILVGRLFGAQQLGFYSRAYSLFMMPISQISSPIANVATSALSRLVGHPQQFRDCYLKYVGQIVSLSFPLAAAMFILADQIIAVLLGPQWMQASVLFKILSTCMLVQPLYNFSGVLFVACGKTDLFFRMGVANTALTVIAFLIGSNFGLEGIAASYAIYNIVQIVPWLALAYSFTLITLGDVAKTSLYPACGGLLCGGCCFVAREYLHSSEWALIAAMLITALCAGLNLRAIRPRPTQLVSEI